MITVTRNRQYKTKNTTCEIATDSSPGYSVTAVNSRIVARFTVCSVAPNEVLEVRIGHNELAALLRMAAGFPGGRILMRDALKRVSEEQASEG